MAGITLEQLQRMGAKPTQQDGGLTLEQLQASGAIPTSQQKPILPIANRGGVGILRTGERQPGDPLSPVRTLTQIPKSAVQLGKDVFRAIRHPIQTLKAVSDIGEGAIRKGIEKIAGKELFKKRGQIGTFEDVASFLKERYGSEEALLKTIEEDPVGFVADVSAVLYGGGAIVRGTGIVTKAQLLARGGATLQKAGLVVEPTIALAKGAFITTKPIRVIGGSLGREILGVTTGAGGEVIRQAFLNPTPEFRQALRGQITIDNVLTAAREGLDAMRTQRANAYKAELAKIKIATQPINIKPFQRFIDNKLKEFNIKINKDGTLDFSRSVIADPTEAKRISDFIQEVRNWDDPTPSGLDILKQRLDDFYTPSGRGRAMTNSISSKLRNLLNKEVPGYAEMTRGYAEATALIKEIEGTLSLKPGLRADTTIRKLTSAMRQNNELRLALVKELDTLTGQNISAQLAGAALSPGVPSGLIGRSIFAGIIGGTVFINPALWKGLLISSPRVVGEFLNVLGLSVKEATKVANYITSPAGKKAIEAAFQAGRAEEQTREIREEKMPALPLKR